MEQLKVDPLLSPNYKPKNLFRKCFFLAISLHVYRNFQFGRKTSTLLPLIVQVSSVENHGKINSFLPSLSLNTKKSDALANEPFNIHQNRTLQCSQNTWQQEEIHTAIPALFDMMYHPETDHGEFGHRTYEGPPEVGINLLWSLQSCQYAALVKWWELAARHGIHRWSAHGGTAMSAYCHRSMNPWDDDIDITVASCKQLEEIYRRGTPVNETYPDLNKKQYWVKNWKGFLLEDKQWILIRGPEGYPWYKLKAVAQSIELPSRDLAGLDIMCFPEGISRSETLEMKNSGFQNAVTNASIPLQVLNYGPTKIKLVPDEVLFNYIDTRYSKKQFCDFPFSDGESPPQHNTKVSSPRSSQMETVLSTWFISEKQREAWYQMRGVANGDNLTKTEIPNLNEVEIDNSIAKKSSCLPYENRTIRFVNWNAERGKYWAAFADMVKKDSGFENLRDPDVIVLNEMDIGMARSGNLHTARQLAFQLGMNYAWGLEFVELTRGTREEQNATQGERNALGLHGNAILSKCPIHNPKVFRDDLRQAYFMNGPSRVNAKGYEVRLGGRMAMFVKTGPKDMSRKQFAVSSVHKINHLTHRSQIWNYLDFGVPPDDNEEAIAVLPNNLAGVLASGDLESRKFCTASGMRNLDKAGNPKTFPADCEQKRLGRWRGDFFCGLMKSASNNNSAVLPCFETGNSEEVQLSDHSMIAIDVQG